MSVQNLKNGHQTCVQKSFAQGVSGTEQLTNLYEGGLKSCSLTEEDLCHTDEKRFIFQRSLPEGSHISSNGVSVL